MEKLRKEYEKIKGELEELENTLEELENTKDVKEYLRLKEEFCTLQERVEAAAKTIYIQMKKREYRECSHIKVISRIEIDGDEGRSYNYKGCMKCGLDERFSNCSGYKNILSLDQQIMSDFVKRGEDDDRTSVDTEILCDLELAKAIYAKIKENHPDIDDETARKYFEIALDDIRNVPVNKKRKTSRAKRLSLNNSFKQWDAIDVRSYS